MGDLERDLAGLVASYEGAWGGKERKGKQFNRCRNLTLFCGSFYNFVKICRHRCVCRQQIQSTETSFLDSPFLYVSHAFQLSSAIELAEESDLLGNKQIEYCRSIECWTAVAGSRSV